MVLISCSTALAQTPLPNGSFEVDVVPTGFTAQVPTDWRQTWGFAYPIQIYRPGEGDAFYGQIPDGDQAVYYTASSSQEIQPGVSDTVGTGIVMEEGVGIRMYFDAVYYGAAEDGQGIQISALNTISYETQFFKPNSAADGFGTFTYEYMPTADDAGKNFSFWCFSTSGTSEFLVDNFRYETFVPLVKPEKPGPVAGGPVIDGGTTPYAWYRADVGVTPYVEDATKLAWWQDQSGNSRHIEAFGEPAITTNGNDGNQVITLDGVDDQIIGAEAEWGTAAPGTVFAVWRRSSEATEEINYVYDADLDRQRQYLNINIAGELLMTGGGEYIADPETWINHSTSDSTDPATNVADPGADEWFVTSVSSTTGTTDTLRINGSEVFSGDLLSGGMSGLRIGRFVLDRYYLNGDIAELIVFEGDLSASERLAIENTLMDRWGIEGVPEPGTLVLFAGMTLLLFRRRKRYFL